MNNPGVLMFHSPLKKRDFIHLDGREYQIIKFLRATTTLDKGVIYRVRDIGTNEVVNITLPYDIQPYPEEKGKEDNFFQILDLNEADKEVTLKSWLTRVERRMKVRWDEDVDTIRDGLMVEDKDLFCSLGIIMGKEVIGDFTFMPKGPPIMNMPDEMIDLIFSKLSPEDRLTCRLVTRRWTTLLLITNFVKFVKLFINPDEESSPITAEFHRLDIPNHPMVENDVGGRTKCKKLPIRSQADMALDYHNPKTHMKDLQPLILASLLEDLDDLEISSTSKIKHHLHLETLAQHCTKLTQFYFKDATEDAEAAESNYALAKKIIAANNGHLISVRVATAFRELDLAVEEGGAILGCTSPKHRNVMLCRRHSALRNFKSMQPSIVILTIGGVVFTKSQLLAITSKFPELKYLDLEVHHNHSDNSSYSSDDMDENEVDRYTVSQILNDLPSLQRVSLSLGPSIERGTRVCRKACELRAHEHGLPRFYYSTYLPYICGNPKTFEVLAFKLNLNA